jgi:Quinohemoprotein amine dehydrogenase, alpha subunit domain III
MKSMSKLEKEFCADTLLERPRYFPRQLITPAELTLEQTYFRDRLRRHNRLLHGWGVVCGADVCAVPTPDGTEAQPWKVRIKPGYILGPYGDEIVIDTEREVDLRSSGAISVCGEPPGPHVDPWCSEVLVKPQSGPLYIAVKYKEILSRPVRVQPFGCGCDETHCEYSRFCDGYEIGILSDCPESHHNPPNLAPDGKPDLELLVQGAAPNCPQCPTEPWVGLAKVELDDNGVIQSIDNCSCRRNVITFSRFWWQCHSKMVRVDTVKPATLEPGKSVSITIRGASFDEKAEVTLGQGVTVEKDAKVTDDGATLTVTVNVAANASGSRLVRVTNPDCSTGAVKVTIAAPPAKGGSTQPTTPPTRPTAQPTTPRPAGRRRRGGK